MRGWPAGGVDEATCRRGWSAGTVSGRQLDVARIEQGGSRPSDVLTEAGLRTAGSGASRLKSASANLAGAAGRLSWRPGTTASPRRVLRSRPIDCRREQVELRVGQRLGLI